jgi:hypothetical protein
MTLLHITTGAETETEGTMVVVFNVTENGKPYAQIATESNNDDQWAKMQVTLAAGVYVDPLWVQVEAMKAVYDVLNRDGYSTFADLFAEVGHIVFEM